MCGAVRFTTTGEPARIIHCHCEDCRKHTGAPMATLPVFGSAQVAFNGDERTVYRSSDTVGRAFCAKCGAPSVPAQAGWQRDCPACGAHHFPRTDPVVINSTISCWRG